MAKRNSTLGPGFTITPGRFGGGEGTPPPPPEGLERVKPGFGGGGTPPPPGIPPRSVAASHEAIAEGSPVTPQVLQGRYGGVAAINPSFYLVGSANDGAGWEAVTVDRPTVLIPKDPVQGVIRYSPLRATGMSDSDLSLVASGSGTVFLWSPGTWWVKYDVTGANMGFIQVPCEDPAAAGMFASRPGCMAVNPTSDEGGTSRIQFASKGSAATLASANYLRRAITITVGDTGASNLEMAVVMGSTGPSNADDAHFLVNQNSVITLQGDTLWKGTIRGIILSSSAASAVDVYVAEFY